MKGGLNPLFSYSKFMDTGKISEYIETLLEPTQFLVEVSLKPSTGEQKLLIVMDDDNGMNIDYCGVISRAVGNYIEENELIEDAYRLEVTSAGLDQPFLLVRQYKKNVGREVFVLKTDNTELQGELLAADEEKIEIQPSPKKKKNKIIETYEPQTLSYDEINYTKLIIKF